MARIRAAAEAGITIAANPNRVEVRVDGLVIADSTHALVMRAPGTPDVPYLGGAGVISAGGGVTFLLAETPKNGERSFQNTMAATFLGLGAVGIGVGALELAVTSRM